MLIFIYLRVTFATSIITFSSLWTRSCITDHTWLLAFHVCLLSVKFVQSHQIHGGCYVLVCLISNQNTCNAFCPYFLIYYFYLASTSCIICRWLVPLYPCWEKLFWSLFCNSGFGVTDYSLSSYRFLRIYTSSCYTSRGSNFVLTLLNVTMFLMAHFSIPIFWHCI